MRLPECPPEASGARRVAEGSNQEEGGPPGPDWPWDQKAESSYLAEEDRLRKEGSDGLGQGSRSRAVRGPGWGRDSRRCRPARDRSEWPCCKEMQVREPKRSWATEHCCLTRVVEAAAADGRGRHREWKRRGHRAVEKQRAPDGRHGSRATWLCWARAGRRAGGHGRSVADLSEWALKAGDAAAAAAAVGGAGGGGGDVVKQVEVEVCRELLAPQRRRQPQRPRSAST